MKALYTREVELHVIAIRRAVHARHPFIAPLLCRAFCESKQIALEKMRYSRRCTLLWFADDFASLDSATRAAFRFQPRG